MFCEQHGGRGSRIGKREPTAKKDNFSIDPTELLAIRTTIHVERTASKGRSINTLFLCCVDWHSIEEQYFYMAYVDEN